MPSLPWRPLLLLPLLRPPRRLLATLSLPLLPSTPSVLSTSSSSALALSLRAYSNSALETRSTRPSNYSFSPPLPLLSDPSLSPLPLLPFPLFSIGRLEVVLAAILFVPPATTPEDK